MHIIVFWVIVGFLIGAMIGSICGRAEAKKESSGTISTLIGKLTKRDNEYYTLLTASAKKDVFIREVGAAIDKYAGDKPNG
jgi:hypothetical protein